MIFKKIIAWLKNYWWIPLIIIGLIFLLPFAPKSAIESLQRILDRQRKTHKEEIRVLEDIKKEELRKREEAQQIYFKTIEKIKEDSNELSDKKKKEIGRLSRKYKDDPEGLAKEIANRYGLIIED